jgi:hypothetical protein
VLARVRRAAPTRHPRWRRGGRGAHEAAEVVAGSVEARPGTEEVVRICCALASAASARSARALHAARGEAVAVHPLHPYRNLWRHKVTPIR